MADLIEDGEAWKRIFDCGIYYRAMHLSFNNREAVEELIKCFCCHAECVPQELFDKYCSIDTDEYTMADFANKNVNMDDLIEIVEAEFLTEEGNYMPYDVECWYKCKLMMKQLNLRDDYIPTLIKHAKQWFYDDGSCRYEGSPTFLINAATAFSNYKECASMTEERRAFWALYLAILSIVGKKEYVGTTSSMIKARLAGANSTKDLKDKLKAMPKTRKQLYEKYTTRRHYEHLMLDLQLNHMIVEYGAHRHTYISTKLKLKELITYVTLFTRTQRAKQLASQKAKAKQEIEEQIKKTDYIPLSQRF